MSTRRANARIPRSAPAPAKADDRKQRFIRALAEYLVSDQALMSMKLETRRPEAVAWLKLRNETPLRGYLTVAEAEEQLAEWLGIK